MLQRGAIQAKFADRRIRDPGVLLAEPVQHDIVITLPEQHRREAQPIEPIYR